MANHQMEIDTNGKTVTTLGDILPQSGELRVLFVAKTPAPVSVQAGHYFQGRQGTMFWNKLVDYGVLRVPRGEFHDDHLLSQGYGITDIVKLPRGFGHEPSDEEYRVGLKRILDLIAQFKPKVVVFVYKRVLDNILEMAFQRFEKADYGFNEDLADLFGAKVFVFPMPGTPCTREQAHKAMSELSALLGK